MSDSLPIGAREDQHLEFKGRESMRDTVNVSRAVVGMLNAKGGDVWIGVREDHGVAVEVEGVDAPDRAVRLLIDHFIETIEPPPRDEVEITQVAGKGGKVALRIHVQPRGSRGPYAYVRRGGRHFVVRVGDRLRYLAREELFPDRVNGEAARAWNRVRRKLEDEAQKMIVDRTPRLWLGLQPVAATRIERDHGLFDYFTDPAKTGNRRTGWIFVNWHDRPVGTATGIVHGDPEYRYTQVRDDGGIRFTVPLEHLYWRDQPRTLWPYSLIEYPVSVFRLASHLYRKAVVQDDDRVAVRLALIAVEGWKLKAGSPGTVQWLAQAPKALSDPDFVTQVLERRWRDIIEAPDRCAYPLIKEVYEAFGFFKEDIPKEFDPVTGLHLPP